MLAFVLELAVCLELGLVSQFESGMKLRLRLVLELVLLLVLVLLLALALALVLAPALALRPCWCFHFLWYCAWCRGWGWVFSGVGVDIFVPGCVVLGVSIGVW